MTRAKTIASQTAAASREAHATSDVFELAGWAVEVGDLAAAVEILGGLHGGAAAAVAGWRAAADERVRAEAAVDVAAARSVLICAQLAE